jgi:hypothetical protein
MSFGSTAKSIIASLAPTVGTALGGPFGAIAGNMLAKALGATDEKSTEAILLSQSPEDLLKVKQLELDFQSKMAELGIQNEQLMYADIDSARKREEVVKDATPRQMAWLIVGGSIALGVGVVTGVTTKDPAMAGTVGIVIGYVFGEAKQVLSYYFGSSSGSADKSATLAKIAGDAALPK